jgi:hypothetical protein
VRTDTNTIAAYLGEDSINSSTDFQGIVYRVENIHLDATDYSVGYDHRRHVAVCQAATEHQFRHRFFKDASNRVGL